MKGSGSIYVVSWVTNGVGPEIDYFYTTGEAIAYMETLVDDGAPSIETDDPEDFIGQYYDWVRQKNDNMCDTDISILRIKT